MGQAQSCVDLHDGDGARPPVQSYLTPACQVCRGMIIPGDRTVICRGGCQHMARLRSAGVAWGGEKRGWRVEDEAGVAHGSARAALEASKRVKRQGVVYEYTSKVHRSCMSSQRIRVARMGSGKQTLCKDCVAFHNFNAGRSSTSKRLSAYCAERAQLDRERTRQDQNVTDGEATETWTCEPMSTERQSLPISLPPGGRENLEPEPDSDELLRDTTAENQQDVCNHHVIIEQVQKQREAHNRRRESLKGVLSKNMAVLKQACGVALAADARACGCKDASRVRFLRQEAKFAYLFVNQCVPDAVRAAEALRCHIVEQTRDYCYDPREKESDAAAVLALDKSLLQLRALQSRYEERTAFFRLEDGGDTGVEEV